jgi:hypothetical protein
VDGAFIAPQIQIDARVMGEATPVVPHPFVIKDNKR